MKQVVLVSDKMAGIPIVECNGAVLTPDKKLVVSEQLGNELVKHYAPRIIKLGDIDHGKLTYGHYDLLPAQISKPFHVDPKSKIPAESVPVSGSPSLEGVASDRSMIGKRIKKKGV